MANPSLNVTGDWIGTWWPHLPGVAENQCKSLRCTVAQTGAAWHAIFNAECDQAYTFTVAMEGRLSGNAVLFQGTTDLGEQGGVFNWIGRATASEFVGFFTSSDYVGEFRMERK